MDRVDAAHPRSSARVLDPAPDGPVEQMLDAIAADLDRLEVALAARAVELPEANAMDLLRVVGPLAWSDAQRTRATALLERNERVALQIAIRMRGTTHARHLLADPPAVPRYLDTTA